MPPHLSPLPGGERKMMRNSLSRRNKGQGEGELGKYPAGVSFNRDAISLVFPLVQGDEDIT